MSLFFDVLIAACYGVSGILAAVVIGRMARRFILRHGPWQRISYGNLSLRVTQLRAIAAIDRAPIVRRLVAKNGMAPAEAEIAVAEYQAFLAIAAAARGQAVAPTSVPCDAAWHTHILHTQAYARAMRAIFGKPFHHRPSDTPDDPALAEPQQRTARILHGLHDIHRWSGLADARKARDIPAGQPLTAAAVLGMLIAEGLVDFELHANRYYRPENAEALDDEPLPLTIANRGVAWNPIIAMPFGGSGDGGSACDAGHHHHHHHHGSSCSGSSCSGSSCSGTSCSGGSSC